MSNSNSFQSENLKDSRIKSLVKQISSGHSTEISPRTVQKAIELSQDFESSKSLMFYLMYTIDIKASHSFPVHKCLFIIESCIRANSINFRNAAKNYIQDIKLITLLSFEGKKSVLRKQIHKTAMTLYYNLMFDKPLDNEEFQLALQQTFHKPVINQNINEEVFSDQSDDYIQEKVNEDETSVQKKSDDLFSLFNDFVNPNDKSNNLENEKTTKQNYILSNDIKDICFESDDSEELKIEMKNPGSPIKQNSNSILKFVGFSNDQSEFVRKSRNKNKRTCSFIQQNNNIFATQDGNNTKISNKRTYTSLRQNNKLAVQDNNKNKQPDIQNNNDELNLDKNKLLLMVDDNKSFTLSNYNNSSNIQHNNNNDDIFYIFTNNTQREKNQQNNNETFSYLDNQRNDTNNKVSYLESDPFYDNANNLQKQQKEEQRGIQINQFQNAQFSNNNKQNNIDLQINNNYSQNQDLLDIFETNQNNDQQLLNDLLDDTLVEDEKQNNYLTKTEIDSLFTQNYNSFDDERIKDLFNDSNNLKDPFDSIEIPQGMNFEIEFK